MSSERDEGARDAEPMRWWHLAVVVVCVLTALAVAFGSHRPVLGVTVVLALFLVCWFAFGRTALRTGRGRLPFTAVVLTACLAGTLLDPSFATFQVIAYPLIWTLSRSVRAALVANVAVAAAVSVGYLADTRDPVVVIIVESVSLGFSVVMGLWISYYADLSEQRRTLIAELTEAQAEVAALSREAGIALERERLSRELHDTIAQSLTAVVMLAERARTRHPDDSALAVLEESAREALGDTRGLVAATASVALEGGLAAAMSGLAGRFERETGVVVTTSVQADVPRGLEVVLLRCAQEGLANVRKHARAAHAWLRVEQSDSTVLLTVEDDGVGLADSAPAGFGLPGMRDRVALVGGSLELRPRTPTGVALTVSVPADERVVTA